MNLRQLKRLFAVNGCERIYVKDLAPNDNSKNQVYLGGSFDILNIFPISEIKNEPAGDWAKERFKASLNFSWLGDNGNLYPAPQSQFILYPKYPEIRFSGFLVKCEHPPSELMTQRLAHRLLFLGVGVDGTVIGYVTGPDSTLAYEFHRTQVTVTHGVFNVIELPIVRNNREKLLAELSRIHRLGWIKSKKLNKDGSIGECESTNCGGYTLEAELGITPNGFSEPDYLGWEVKQFGVSNFKTTSAVITLMTPEPTNGFYVEKGVEAFIRKYGYADASGKTGREDRFNFGGVHKAGIIQSRTKLRLELIGYDAQAGKIRHSDGQIALVDSKDNAVAGWSFASMLKHWTRKHNQACYVPSIADKTGDRKYMYGNKIILGSGTDFQLFLGQMACGNIYYDPGIKLENASTKPKIKRRSQFRIKSQHLINLYKQNEVIDIK